MRRNQDILRILPPASYKRFWKVYGDRGKHQDFFLQKKFLEGKFIKTCNELKQKYNIETNEVKGEFFFVKFYKNKKFERDFGIFLRKNKIPKEHKGNVQLYIFQGLQLKNRTVTTPYIEVRSIKPKPEDFNMKISPDTSNEDVKDLLSFFKKDLLKQFGLKAKRKRETPTINIGVKIVKLKHQRKSSKEISKEFGLHSKGDKAAAVDKIFSRLNKPRT